MRSELYCRTREYLMQRQKTKQWRKLVSVLAIVVICCTVLALKLPAITKEGETFCGYTEHMHSDAECYQTSEISGERTCSCMLEEHSHVLECFSNPDADVETAEVWKQTFADVELTGDWDVDLLAIAKTQLGYTESTENYIVLEDGETMNGYTRYGDWYGITYGDWCAMYVSFCINYAGIQDFPIEASCQRWIEILSGEEYGYYHEVGTYIPVPGDLIFFNYDEYSDSDHVGIVVEYIAPTESEGAKVTTIEGNASEQVRYNTYETTDESIMGYGQLPEEPEAVVEPEVEENSGEAGADPDATEENSEEISDGVDNTPTVYASNNPANGDKYHAKKYLYYHMGAHYLDGGAVCVFMLTPSDQYSDNTNVYKPYPTDNWTADVDSNYVTAYCCDHETYSSDSGENYKTYVLADSRFMDEDTRRTLGGIIAHAYPFISESEMKQEMKSAGIDISSCDRSELITGVQWAIWDMTNVTGSIGGVTKYSKPSSTDSTVFNKIKKYSEHNQYSNHIKSIRNWLISQKMPEELAVQDYDTIVTPNGDGMYNLEVVVSLNRAVGSDEQGETKLIAGDKVSDLVPVYSGTETFTLKLNSLTEQEVRQAEIYLSFNGQRIQTYYYDSENYQDLIGGKKENFSRNLSFQLGTEKTEVSVTKQWANNDVGASSVKVQLYANGAAHGDKVTLNAANNWTYTWEELAKYDVTMQEITYTVEEDVVDGYLSVIQIVEGEAETIDVWKQVDSFTSGKEYLLVTKSGVLKTHTFKNNNRLSWGTTDISDAESVPNEMRWKASNVNGNGATLKNLRDGANANLGLSNSVLIPGKNSTMYYDGSHIYTSVTSGSWWGGSSTTTNYYFSKINSDGEGVTVTSTENGDVAVFKLYELQQETLPPSNIKYLITNTKVIGKTQVQVEKQWKGHPEAEYPANVQVKLLQNGKTYGSPVTLNADNNWSYTWSDLPKTVGNTEISYEIEELAVDGYESTISSTKNDSGYNYVITNTWIPQYAALKIHKVDADDVTKFLSGAEFELYHAQSLEQAQNGQGSLVKAFSVAQNDGFTVDELEIGQIYYLQEREAPEGYNKLTEPIIFKVSKNEDVESITVLSGDDWVTSDSSDGLGLKVKNQVGFTLPETGGAGTTFYTMIGISLMGIACYFIYTLEEEKRGLKE